jgi:hypothetical protein
MSDPSTFSVHAWEAFYVIVGSSAGALTGLQFVVLTLITEAGTLRGSGEALSAFASPNIVHFCAALLVSAIFSAPWEGVRTPGFAAVICGVSGVVYSINVLRRALNQREYKPVLEDWIWHATLPILTYAGLAVAGLQLARSYVDALYVIAAAALMLLFIGIHNAWDTVVYTTLQRSQERRAEAAKRAVAERPAETPSFSGGYFEGAAGVAAGGGPGSADTDT